MVDTASDEKAKQQSKAPFIRTMGTHRRYEHLQECYMIGSPDRLNERIDDLRRGRTAVPRARSRHGRPQQIDLMAKRIVKQFSHGAITL